jgi:hypothetical protein
MGVKSVPLPEVVKAPVNVTPLIVALLLDGAVIDQEIALAGIVKLVPLATETKYGVKGCPHPAYRRAGAFKTSDGA